MGESTPILGLPTGLGKTYLASTKLYMESREKPIRILFLVSSCPIPAPLRSRARLNICILISANIMKVLSLPK